ncbi:hypothetical protein PV328_010255 [Microctonus aethiopoides]|uniref:Uncharacterized protein n=1 Tax=Microctonus aethiopoides TaxID=144406 RepID=A0AA39C7K2_9HYME|nr:hypothetical protein PV328_010255 [Microctonus aethiopoides]
MGQGTECAERPTEVSVIRFVSRNRTIEEIAPKKEIYTCKQTGCGKIFTNFDEYKTHEALEELKIRFICREPGCGKELSDPGTMWRHYQECHSNETNLFVCPYTSCGSLHGTSENLEEHIESCHRQPPTLPTEPEIICFEGPGSTSIDEDISRNDDEEIIDDNDDDDYIEKDKKYNRTKKSRETLRKNNYIVNSKNLSNNTNVYTIKDERLMQESCNDNNISANTLSENEIIREDFFINNKYDEGGGGGGGNICQENDDSTNLSFTTDDTKFVNNDFIIEDTEKKLNEHRIDLGNLERVFRSGFEGEQTKIESNNIDNNGSVISDDEEYTPKKQRMSRYKQEPYKCEINGCGKMYKYISHYRHHQDSHKVQESKEINKPTKLIRPKQGKATTVSFFLCKMPGCGAQVNNVTSLWKHYQDNHANSKESIVQSPKNNQLFRCKIPNCEMEFRTSVQLYKHFNDVHTNGTALMTSTNGKTGGDSDNIHFVDERTQNDNNTTNAQGNFKTDFKANCNVNMNGYDEDNDDRSLIPLIRIKEESHD